jgi:polar amino acid transport system permease protein
VEDELMWDWGYALDILPDLLKGLRITIEATLLGSAIAAVLGLLLAIGRRSRHRLVRMPVAGFVEFVRSTPLLVQLYFIFFVLPDLGLTLSALTAGVIGLGLHYSTYASEVYRAGIEGVPRGQWEASVALNFSARRTWTSVVLPQAIPAVVPALGNYLIAMFKDTPLLAAITVVELLNEAQELGAQSFRYVEPITLVGVLFLVVSLVSAVLIRRLEARLALP